MIVAAQTYLQKQGLALEVSDAAVVRSLWQQMRVEENDTDESYLAGLKQSSSPNEP